MTDEKLQETVLLLLDIEERIDDAAVRAFLQPHERVFDSIRWSASGGEHRFRVVGNRSTVNWHEDLPVLDRVVARCLASLRAAPSRRLIVCAYAPLPMLLYLGVWLFGYAHRVDVVNLARPPYPALRVSLDRSTSEEPVFRVEGLPSSPSNEKGVLALYVSTAPISDADQGPAESIRNSGQRVAATVQVHPTAPLDVDAAITSRAVFQLATLVERLNQMFPAARDLAVFLRGPAQLAVALGRSINAATWSSVRFALHNGKTYAFPVEIPAPDSTAGGPASSASLGPVKTILHLSDLHLKAETNITTFAQPLLMNLRDDGHPAAAGIDHVVITGDLTNRATEGEFKKAAEFVRYLSTQLNVPLERFVVAPGNHDLSWDVPVYQWRWKRQIKDLAPESYVVVGGENPGGLWRDPAEYPKRFASYVSHFYKPLFGSEWALDPAKQFEVKVSDDGSLAFVALNSACEIDEARKENAQLNEHAVAEALSNLSPLRRGGVAPVVIAAWHHPISEGTRASGLLERFSHLGAKLCLHGHVHEDRVEFLQYIDHKRRLYAIGAGTLGAPAEDRPESTPRLFNVVQVHPKQGRARVHAFGAPRKQGAFGPYARWPGASAGTLQNWYDLDL